jgi:tetratricopeptide (TPR) repeat protein
MSDLKAQYQEAFGAFARGDLTGAVTRYETLVGESPGFALGFQGLAEVYARLGQLDDAIAAIRRAIELEPEESLYHTSLSRFLQRQGNIPAAEEAAAQASRLQRS